MSRTLHHSKFNAHIQRGKKKIVSMRRSYLRSLKTGEFYIETPVSKKLFGNKLVRN